MANQAVVENLSRTRARAMQDRVETTQSERSDKRQWRIPELAVGLALMLGGALGAILLSRSGDSIVVVAGAANDLQRGQKIAPQDLIAIETPLSLSGSFVTESEASSLIGQTLLIDLHASTPLTTSMFSDQQQLRPAIGTPRLACVHADVQPLLARRCAIVRRREARWDCGRLHCFARVGP